MEINSFLTPRQEWDLLLIKKHQLPDDILVLIPSIGFCDCDLLFVAAAPRGYIVGKDHKAYSLARSSIAGDESSLGQSARAFWPCFGIHFRLASSRPKWWWISSWNGAEARSFVIVFIDYRLGDWGWLPSRCKSNNGINCTAPQVASWPDAAAAVADRDGIMQWEKVQRRPVCSQQSGDAPAPAPEPMLLLLLYKQIFWPATNCCRCDNRTELQLWLVCASAAFACCHPHAHSQWRPRSKARLMPIPWLLPWLMAATPASRWCSSIWPTLQPSRVARPGCTGCIGCTGRKCSGLLS